MAGAEAVGRQDVAGTLVATVEALRKLPAADTVGTVGEHQDETVALVAEHHGPHELAELRGGAHGPGTARRGLRSSLARGRPGGLLRGGLLGRRLLGGRAGVFLGMLFLCLVASDSSKVAI